MSSHKTFTNPNFQHKIWKSSLSSFPCQFLLWMETHRKFIQAVANNHFSSFWFQQGGSFRERFCFHVCPIPQSFVEGWFFTCSRLRSKNSYLRVRFAQLWSNLLLLSIDQITPKLLVLLFWIDFRLPVGAVFFRTSANGCCGKAGADWICPRVGCAEGSRESWWWGEGGGGKEGRRRGGGRRGKEWRRGWDGALMTASSVISHRVAKVHKRLKNGPWGKNGCGLGLEKNSFGVRCWRWWWVLCSANDFLCVVIRRCRMEA